MLIFVLVGGLWVLVTDYLVPRYHLAAHLVAVVVTAGLIWWIVDRFWRQRLRLEQKYQQIQRLEAVGRLAGGIAHDFNNILTAIGGYTEFAADEAPPDSSLRQDLGTVQDGIEKARVLTKRLLTFSRQQPMKTTSVILNELVESTVELGRRTMRGVEISTELDERLAPMRVDPGQVEQVLLNLLINARDALQDDGWIRVTTAQYEIGRPDQLATPVPMKPGRYARLRITDNGHGMDQATLQHIFEPFFTTKEAGTGMGLASSYGIVRQHGGYIWATSMPGKGTTFEIYLPMEPPGGEQPESG